MTSPSEHTFVRVGAGHEFLIFSARPFSTETNAAPQRNSKDLMSTYKVVVDGSNIATEGRTKPSLNQLDEAVRAFIEEHPGADVLVIVDSSFPNRIEQSELAIFESAYAAGEIITPPAGTIGRGDSFILKVAEKLNATVFSNDSFQEFHGTYDWLFEKNRLVGGKPIPGTGLWVFTPRTPVRGPKSREAMRDAKRTRVRVGSKEASVPMPKPKAPPPFVLKQVADHALAIAEVAAEGDAKRGRRKRAFKKEEAVAAAVLSGAVEAADDRKRKKKRRRKGGVERSVESVNDALPFLTFVAAHTIGSSLDGEVLEYSSHGFFVDAGGVKCYVPLIGLADPTPRSAKEVVRRGDTRSWIVRSFDPLRRSIELALVGTPNAASVVMPESDPSADTPSGPGRARKAAKKVAAVAKAAKRAVATVPEAVAPIRTSARKGRAVAPSSDALDGLSVAAAALGAAAAVVKKETAKPRRAGAARGPTATATAATKAPSKAPAKGAAAKVPAVKAPAATKPVKAEKAAAPPKVAATKAAPAKTAIKRMTKPAAAGAITPSPTPPRPMKTTVKASTTKAPIAVAVSTRVAKAAKKTAKGA